ncbi:EI24 domain-containing protein [Pendulispora rubella]|uniref:EI24 domain-containing protein n=1 Tax=Pendulispora rubella TaxID=2741070 RepID=A0ABZ2L981_9BACT
MQGVERPGKLGWADGFRTFFQGFGFVVARPAVWPYAAVPMLAACALTVVLAVLGIWAAGDLVDAVFDAFGGAHEGGGYVATRIVVYVLVVGGAMLLASSLAQPLSGPALDRIVRAQEAAAGRAPLADAPFFESVRRSLKITLVTLAIGVPVFVTLSLVELLFPPAIVVTWPLKLVASALLASWNLLDYPFGLRRMGFRQRVAFYQEHLGPCFAFGVPVALIALIPFLGLLMLPVGVAGATRLVIACEDER